MNLTANKFCIENARELAVWADRAYSCATLSVPRTDTQVLIEEFPDYIVVAFRGTSSVKDFITDAKAWRAFTPLGGIHSGFWEAWQSIAEPLYQALKTYGFKPVVLCGHSLGGALAQIAAIILRQSLVNVHSVYCFGAPRSGDKKFQSYYNSLPVPGSPFDNLGDATFTLINHCDVVARIPGWLAGYRRPGHDEFVSILTPNRIDEDPSVIFRLFSDAVSLYDAWCARRDPIFVDELLIDHRMANYLIALGISEPTEEVMRA